MDDAFISLYYFPLQANMHASHGFSYETMRRAEAAYNRHHHPLSAAAAAAASVASDGSSIASASSADHLVSLQHASLAAAASSGEHQVAI